MTITTATFISTIVVGAVASFTERGTHYTGTVVGHGLTHRNDGFVHDHPADVPCLRVRVEEDTPLSRVKEVLASQLVHVSAPVPCSCRYCG